MRRNLLLLTIAAGALLLGLTACGDAYDSPDVTPAALTEPSPASAASLVPRRTNIPEVDAVLDAVEAGDVERIKSLLRYTPMPCGPPTSDSAVHFCRPEEPEGTLVDLLPVSLCKHVLFRRDEVDSHLRAEVVDPTLQAASKAPPGFEPPAQYVAVFSKPRGEIREGLAIAIDEGQIVKIFFALHIDDRCAQTAADLVEALSLGDTILQ